MVKQIRLCSVVFVIGNIRTFGVNSIRAWACEISDHSIAIRITVAHEQPTSFHRHELISQRTDARIQMLWNPNLHLAGEQ